jgi:hypothetical protein
MKGRATNDQSINCRKPFNRFDIKRVILGTSHILRKILQTEKLSLSVGDSSCFKEENYWFEKPVARDL